MKVSEAGASTGRIIPVDHAALLAPSPSKIQSHLRQVSIRWTFKASRAFGVRTITHQLRCGYSMLLDTNDLLGQRLVQEETFEPLVRREFARYAGSGGSIIDIGANIGYYSLLGASMVSRNHHVFAFEPQPGVIKKLRRNIALNQLRNVTVFPFALAEQPSVVKFFVPEEGAEGHGSLCENGRFAVRETVDVETRRLDDVIAELGEPEICAVKMDAEGAELLILRGATRLLQRRLKPVLIFEANEDNCRPFGTSVFDLLQYINGFGYRLRQIDKEDWIAEPEPRL